MRKTWMKIGLIAAVAAASWAGNLWYFRSHQLGEVWFLDHQIEVYRLPIQASGQLRLSYSVRRNELPADSMYRILLKAELEEPGTGHRKTLRSEAAASINILPSLTEDDVRSLAQKRREEQ